MCVRVVCVLCCVRARARARFAVGNSCPNPSVCACVCAHTHVNIHMCPRTCVDPPNIQPAAVALMSWHLHRSPLRCPPSGRKLLWRPQQISQRCKGTRGNLRESAVQVWLYTTGGVRGAYAALSIGAMGELGVCLNGELYNPRRDPRLIINLAACSGVFVNAPHFMRAPCAHLPGNARGDIIIFPQNAIIAISSTRGEHATRHPSAKRPPPSRARYRALPPAGRRS